MAYIRQPNLNNDPRQQATQQSGVIGSGGTNSQGTSPISNNWTNLNAYINQNEGAGSAMADELLKSGNQEVDKLNNAGSEFANSAKSSIDSATKKDNGYGNMFATGDMSGFNEQKKNEYGAWKNQKAYTGINDASESAGYNNLNSQRANATAQAGRSSTLDGQYGLAKDSFGKGNDQYNKGMSMLDTILTRQAGGGEKLDKFNAENTEANLQNKVNNVIGGVNQYIGQKRAEGEAVTGNVQNALQNRYNQEQDIDALRSMELAGAVGSKSKDAQNYIRARQAGMSTMRSNPLALNTSSMPVAKPQATVDPQNMTVPEEASSGQDNGRPATDENFKAAYRGLEDKIPVTAGAKRVGQVFQQQRKQTEGLPGANKAKKKWGY